MHTIQVSNSGWLFTVYLGTLNVRNMYKPFSIYSPIYLNR